MIVATILLAAILFLSVIVETVGNLHQHEYLSIQTGKTTKKDVGVEGGGSKCKVLYQSESIPTDSPCTNPFMRFHVSMNYTYFGIQSGNYTSIIE